ncbi:hypothetical protein OV320_7837 [Actinobacteria bacterium OV320]|nr:hypothetical protein OV320_7837 [Actinobacteria bacterium OV320]
MRYRVFQDETTHWDVDHQHVRFFVYGAWVQNNGSIEEASKFVEGLLEELRRDGFALFSIGTQPYTFVAI